MIQIKIDDEQFKGERLDKFFVSQFHLFKLDPAPTRSYVQNLINESHLLVNHKKSKASYLLRLNDIITFEAPPVKESKLIPWNKPLDIIYEDDCLIVINKPSGLVIHPAAGHEQDTLVNALLYHTPNLSMKNEQRPGIVHRIDKETSGLLVVAKNDHSHEILSQQFKNKTTHRIYYALAEGTIKNSKSSIESILARHPTDRKKYASLKSHIHTDIGKWAKTHFEVLEYSHKMTLLKLKLETGRTHQIRVHISELGHPLVGDTLYGYSPKKMKELNITRFYLHAAELGFTHPLNQKQMLFKTSWPSEDLLKIKSWNFTHESL